MPLVFALPRAAPHPEALGRIKTNMQKLIEQLKQLSETLRLEDNYTWEVPSNTPVSIPSNIFDNFSRNIYLKENLRKSLENDDELKNHYWIIQEWGGIRTFKKNGRNDQRITEFKSQLDSGTLKRPTFNLISSLSKIASFMQPNKYAIYDSRAIYALNWLLFCYSEKKQLFPQPAGRSAELAKYDIQTIIRLADKGHEYKSHKTAYHDYCRLLKELSKNVYSDDNPYKVEMLLFLAAPTKIIDSIMSSVSISINSNV